MTSYNTYDVGDVVRVSAAFTNASDVAADPTTVKLYYRDPSDGTITELEYGQDAEIVKESTGNYYADLEPDAAGVWFYKWEGSGSVTATVEGFYKVRESNVL